jgi:hypothetical protein
MGGGVCRVRELQVGPTITSGELVGVPTVGPIEKPGLLHGRQARLPVAGKVRVGGSITREELSRDDSLVQYLFLNNLYGVSMGKKDRNLIARGFIDINRLVNVNFFWVDISTPFPWAERQLAGVGSDRIQRSRDGPRRHHGHGPHPLSPLSSMPVSRG